jgi:hypothetical protein
MLPTPARLPTSAMRSLDLPVTEHVLSMPHARQARTHAQRLKVSRHATALLEATAAQKDRMHRALSMESASA